MTGKKPATESSITLGNQLGDAFEQLQNRIRDRAYHIFLEREPLAGDATEDWLHAQSELLRPIELVIKEQKKNLVAECNLKGFAPEDIEIEVDGGVLKVLGHHKESHTGKNKDGATESSSESIYFFQSAQLPVGVDLNESHAKLFKNGKLKVTLPKLSPD